MSVVQKRTSAALQPINILLTLHFFLVLGFDYIGESVRLLLAGGITSGYAALAIYSALAKSKKTEKLLLLLVILIISGWLWAYVTIPTVSVNPNVSAVAAFRNLAPFFAAIAIISNAANISRRLLVVGSVLIVVSAAVHAVVMPPVYLNTSWRWAPFSAGLHTSAYTIALATLLLLELFVQKFVGRNITYLFVGIGLLIFYYYGVRTALILAFVFFAVDFAQHMARRTKVGSTQFLLVLISLMFISLPAILFVLSGLGFEELSYITSGRLANYVERFADIWGRPLSTFLFGTGPGSDKLVTAVWWWIANNAHNDFITLLWEGGVLALVAMLAFLFVLYRKNSQLLLAPVLAIVVSSAASNALFVRPNVAFLMFCLMALRIGRPENKVKYLTNSNLNLLTEHPPAASPYTALKKERPTRRNLATRN